MKGPNRKPVIGLMGGIGSGKSTVAAEFANLGSAVICADTIAHELLEQPEVRRQVVDLFGQEILTATGRIDRSKVAELVFDCPERVSALNSLLHPLVMEEVEQRIRQYQALDNVRAIVLDIPLLVEVGWANRCNRLVFVDCDRLVREHRAYGLTADQIRQRENLQISLDRKKALADNIIDNNSDVSALGRPVADLFSDIVGR